MITENEKHGFFILRINESNFVNILLHWSVPCVSHDGWKYDFYLPDEIFQQKQKKRKRRTESK